MSPAEDIPRPSVALRFPVVRRPQLAAIAGEPATARRSVDQCGLSAAAWSERLSLDQREESFLTGLFSDKGARASISASCDCTLKSITKRMALQNGEVAMSPESPKGPAPSFGDSVADPRRLRIRRLLRDAASETRPGTYVGGLALPPLGGSRTAPSSPRATEPPSPREPLSPASPFSARRDTARGHWELASPRSRELPTSPRGREDRLTLGSSRGSVAPRLWSKASDDGKKESLPTYKRKEREACDSLRQMLFGRVGNESAPPEERHLVYELRRGSKEEVDVLVQRWFDMDYAGNGEVDLEDFVVAFKRSKADRFLVEKCMKYFSMVLGPDGSSESEDPQTPSPRRLTRKDRATLSKEDLMRLVWLKATDEDVAAMSTAFDLFLLERAAVEAPPLIPKRQRRQLLETFKELDVRSLGEVPYAALAASGLAEDEMCHHLQSRYDKERTGTFTFERFLEMMCPYGFRAHDGVTSAPNKDGRTVMWVTCSCGDLEFRGWMTEETLRSLEHLYQFKH